MNEYLVLFESMRNAERSGLDPAHITEALGMCAVIVCTKQLPWEIIRECATYTRLHFLRLPRKSERRAFSKVPEYDAELIIKVTQHALTLNMTPVRINQG